MSSIERWLYALLLAMGMIMVIAVMNNNNNKIETKLDQLKTAKAKITFSEPVYINTDTVNIIDEPDTDYLVMSGYSDTTITREYLTSDTITIGYIDQCDDPTYWIEFDTMSIPDWMIRFTPPTEMWLVNNLDTDVVFHYEGDNEWEVYQDSVGVHLKVFRKEAEK